MVGLFANLMRVTLNMSALAALILFCTPLLKKRYSASWRYWVWMVITVRLLIPFQMPAIELPDLSGPFQSAISARMDSATGFENADFSGSGEADSAGCPYPARTVEPDRTTENF